MRGSRRDSAGATVLTQHTFLRGPNIGFFAINLDRSTQRWAAISRRFAGMPWPLYRVAALDAAQDPAAVLAARGQTLALPPSGIGWNPLRHRLFSLVEEACFASHMLALKAFLASEHEYAVILEDDAVPLDGLDETLRQLLTSNIAFDIVKLEGTARGRGRLAVIVTDLGAARLVRSFHPSSGSAGYLVTRSAAAQMIDRAGKLMAPVDDYISNPGLHGCDIMHLSPWLICQSFEDTTMGQLRSPNRHVKRRDPFHFLQQGLTRGGLRLQLWWKAMQGFHQSPFGLRIAPWRPGRLSRRSFRRLAGAPSP